MSYDEWAVLPNMRYTKDSTEGYLGEYTLPSGHRMAFGLTFNPEQETSIKFIQPLD